MGGFCTEKRGEKNATSNEQNNRQLVENEYNQKTCKMTELSLTFQQLAWPRIKKAWPSFFQQSKSLAKQKIGKFSNDFQKMFKRRVQKTDCELAH